MNSFRARWARVREDLYLLVLAFRNGCRFTIGRDTVSVIRDGKEIRIARRNTVYAQDLIRSFDYYFDAVEPERRRGRLLVDYSVPALHTLKEEGAAFWFPQLAEPMETTRIYLERARLEAGQTVLDLGAYAGGAAYHFSRAVGSNGRVFAFEPDPDSFECLVKNIALHRLDNVVADPRGIWSRSGRVLFQAEGNMGSSVAEASARHSARKAWIDAISLPEFAAEAGLDRVDFVKIDVEGSEAQILHGAGDFLRKYRPKLIIEVHFVRGTRSDSEVTGILESHGYVVETLDQAGLPLPLLFARPR